MENESRFDLNRAVLAWKAELAGQPGVSAENTRELETHLLESISTFKRSGLNDEEAFLHALQRMGSTSKIGAEFAKNNLLRIWRDRVFWIAFGGFILALLDSATSRIGMSLAHWAGGSMGEWAAVAAYSALVLIPILGAGLLFASGRIQLLYLRVSWLFASRLRLGIVSLLLTAAVNIVSFQARFALIIFELGFLGFALVMMPREMREAARSRIEGGTDWRKSIRLWQDRLFWIAVTQLAIGTWTAIAQLGIIGYLHSLPGSKLPAPPVLAGVVYFLIWLVPMAVVGVALSMARLSWVTRMFQSRSGILVVGVILLLSNSCLDLWICHFGPVGRISLEQWRTEVLLSSVAWFILQAGLIAVMLWLARSQQRMGEGAETLKC